MKLVEVLAKELVEWPDCGGEFSCDPDGEVRHSDLCRFDFYPKVRVDNEDRCKDYGGEGISISESMWQAEHDRQKGGEWKRHRGGKRPVDPGVRVECRMRNGDVEESSAGGFMWDHNGAEDDVMKYRVISRPQAEEVEVKPELTYKLDWVEVDDAKTDQIDGPIKWRDTIIHCQAIIEDCEREIQRNVDLLDAEGLMMQTDSNKAMQHYAPSIAAEDWQVGDILEIVANIGNYSHEFKIGEQVKIAAFDQDDDKLPIRCDALDGSDFWYIKHAEAKFIRRP